MCGTKRTNRQEETGTAKKKELDRRGERARRGQAKQAGKPSRRALFLSPGFLPMVVHHRPAWIMVRPDMKQTGRQGRQARQAGISCSCSRSRSRSRVLAPSPSRPGQPSALRMAPIPKCDLPPPPPRRVPTVHNRDANGVLGSI